MESMMDKKERAILAVRKLARGSVAENVVGVKRNYPIADESEKKRYRKIHSSFPTPLQICETFSSITGLLERGLIRHREGESCMKCNGDGVLRLHNDERWRCCGPKGCRTHYSLYDGSFFEGKHRLEIHNILLIARLMLDGQSQRQTAGMITIDGEFIAEKTVWYWRNRIKNAIAAYHLSAEGDAAKIGGHGHTVEVDETAMGKIKYGKGHPVKGIWVVVAVCRETREIVATSVENRKKSTLIQWIKDRIHPDTQIITDYWKGYGTKEIEDYTGHEHLRVNHSKTFKDPITGACTNTVEGNNRALKMAIPCQARTTKRIDTELVYFSWARKHEGHLWSAFLDCIHHSNYCELSDLEEGEESLVDMATDTDSKDGYISTSTDSDDVPKYSLIWYVLKALKCVDKLLMM
jgi:transposase-like protein